MYITKKHLSRRTVLQGAGAAIALPLLDAMIPAATALAQTAAKPHAAHGLHLLPAWRRDARPGRPRRPGTNFDDVAHPEAAGAVPLAHDHRQRPAQQGRRELGSARHHGRHLAVLLRRQGPRAATKGITADQLAARHFGRRHAAPVAGAHRRRRQCHLRPGRHRLRLRQHRRLPHAHAAAADGGQPAQGVLPAVRPGRHDRRSARRSSARRTACSTT